MKRIAYTLTLMLIMACAVPVAQARAAQGQKDVDTRVDGQTWVYSTEEEKLAFLLGVEATLATEQILVDRYNEGEKKPVRKASPFVRGWMKAFKDVSRRDIAAQIDAYIAAHPDVRTKHIFEIVWFGLIEPKTGIKGASAPSKAWNY